MQKFRENIYKFSEISGFQNFEVCRFLLTLRSKNFHDLLNFVGTPFILYMLENENFSITFYATFSNSLPILEIFLGLPNIFKPL